MTVEIVVVVGRKVGRTETAHAIGQDVIAIFGIIIHEIQRY